MKTVIKVLVKNRAIAAPVITQNGEWIDLRAAEDVTLPVPTSRREHQVDKQKIRDVRVNNKLISLGVAIQLPEGYEAYILPRSSSYKNFGVILSNSMGIIDNSYCGPNDIWKFNAIALKPCTIKGPRPAYEDDYNNKDLTIVNGYVQGDRICQFRIMLSQKATVWQKLKWLFSNGIKIEIVNKLDNENRGGIGSTGKN